MTRKLTPSELKKSQAHKRKARAAQAKRDKAITKKLASAEKRLAARAKKLKSSKARGKTLERQRVSIAAQAVELIELRRSYKRKEKTTGLFSTIINAGNDFIADFLALSSPFTGESPLYSASSTLKRTRKGYQKLFSLEILPDSLPIAGKLVGVSERGKLVESAILEACRVMSEYSTSRDDNIGLDFAISSSINYPNGRSSMHYSFVDHGVNGAGKYYVDKIAGMGKHADTANTEIVFPIYIHLLRAE